jgi:hypothetical protein
MKSKHLFFGLILSISQIAFAGEDLKKAPQSFATRNQKFVFADFESENVQIVIDVDKKKIKAIAHIEFETVEEGNVLFDLIPNPIKVTVDGIDTTAVEVRDPSTTTTYRALGVSLPAGIHNLRVENEITTNVEFEDGKVKMAFWTSDLTDRQFSEQYFASSFEYDQLYHTYDVIVKDSKGTVYEVFTNGGRTLIEPNHWYIGFSEAFNSSAMFFHLVPQGSVQVLKESFLSVSGEEFLITVYGYMTEDELKPFMDQSKKTLAELEKDYGAWPHRRLVVYATEEGGGMEFHGATITSLFALEHEITHSYFGRGLMPMNGNAGWVDEALASWRDDGYLRKLSPGFESSNMGGQSEYARRTDRRAYVYGSTFMGYLDHLLAATGGLKPILKTLVEKYMKEPFSVQQFRDWLNEEGKVDLNPVFDRYVFTRDLGASEAQYPESKYHPTLTAQQKLDLL